jgi:hypothetical protein
MRWMPYLKFADGKKTTWGRVELPISPQRV